MKKLLKQIEEVDALIKDLKVTSVSFDIDGTLYPIRKVQYRWWLDFFKNPVPAMKFLNIKKNWEKRRKGSETEIVSSSDVDYFEMYLTKKLLHQKLVPIEIRSWLDRLVKNNVEIFFLSDHGAEKKLGLLSLGHGRAINCLRETNQLKPHREICNLLLNQYRIDPKIHLHVGDRWTDEEQARLFGCHFAYFAP